MRKIKDIFKEKCRTKKIKLYGNFFGKKKAEKVLIIIFYYLFNSFLKYSYYTLQQCFISLLLNILKLFFVHVDFFKVILKIFITL